MLDKTKLFPHEDNLESNQDEMPNERIEYKNKQCHYIIKMVFSESHMEFDAAIIIIGNTKNNKFDSVNIAVDGNLNIDISDNWNIFLDEVKDRRKEVYERRSKYNNVIDRFEREFGKICPVKFITNINDDILNTNDNQLLSLLLHDKFINKINEILGHGLTVDDVSILIDKKYYDDKLIKCEEPKVTNIKMEEIYLDVIPVIDPVCGIKVENYTVGQDILVKIVDNTPLGAYLAKALSYDSPDGSVKGKIFEINKKENKEFNKATVTYQIIIKFDDLLKGSFEVETGVKIKNKFDSERVREYKVLTGEIIENENTDEMKTKEELDYKIFIFFIILVICLFTIIMVF